MIVPCPMRERCVKHNEFSRLPFSMYPTDLTRGSFSCNTIKWRNTTGSTSNQNLLRCHILIQCSHLQWNQGCRSKSVRRYQGEQRESNYIDQCEGADLGRCRAPKSPTHHTTATPGTDTNKLQYNYSTRTSTEQPDAPVPGACRLKATCEQATYTPNGKIKYNTNGWKGASCLTIPFDAPPRPILSTSSTVLGKNEASLMFLAATIFLASVH